ncbi:hypothetical protein CF138_03880 [Aeromonas hydrophila]|uniref:DUF6404 family protein n=1 Tax=Aeromonas hydrophila TaxID=644 RepID=UPI0011173FBE|nr:DUF6404 family protein [Aeromonas hydrophila]TNH71507.1 hypothetical protein CF141_15885 [Aeromonas hydrophila]TNH89780.1 hypothetical protein CF138_03880 [Aeromonas hydrophila]TNI01151.1 hypothetical protein CF136_08525 [Aeromonas hydrophila]TNI94868.1 hypothetical protein CF118_14615 [Aeromonas hydrophila]
MTFEERLTIAHQTLADQGIKEYDYNPWMFKLLRKLGCTVKPPYYAGWLVNFLCASLSIAPIWGLIMWTFVWHPEGRSFVSSLFSTALFAGLFGLVTLIRLWLKRRQLDLTPWEQLARQPIRESAAGKG